MSDVIFSEDQVRGRVRSTSSSVFVRLVRRMGLARTDQSAERVLVGVGVICLLATVVLFVFNQQPAPTPETRLDASWPRAR